MTKTKHWCQKQCALMSVTKHQVWNSCRQLGIFYNHHHQVTLSACPSAYITVVHPTENQWADAKNNAHAHWMILYSKMTAAPFSTSVRKSYSLFHRLILSTQFTECNMLSSLATDENWFSWDCFICFHCDSCGGVSLAVCLWWMMPFWLIQILFL